MPDQIEDNQEAVPALLKIDEPKTPPPPPVRLAPSILKPISLPPMETLMGKTPKPPIEVEVKEADTNIDGLLKDTISKITQAAQAAVKEATDKLQEQANRLSNQNTTTITNPLSSKNQDKGDELALRHGRERDVGFKVGNYIQTPPFFFTRDKWPVPIIDQFRGSSCFLIAGGPSFAAIDKDKLNEPGILTMGINNSIKSFRPKMWVCVDDPGNFLMSVWKDPTIRKFVPISHIDKKLFDSNAWKETDMTVGECPEVLYYKRNELFNADQYLFEDTINWGNHTKLGGGRSVLLAAVRILFLLGIRKLFLLGVDFHMDANSKYHFDQSRTPESISGNNSTYRSLQERFTKLKPIFDKHGFQVYNCNQQSRLTAFPYMSFDDAFKMARSVLPSDLSKERSDGLYDRKANIKKEANKLAPSKLPNNMAKGCDTHALQHIKQIEAQTDVARSALHAAKDLTAEMRRLKETNDPLFNIQKLRELEEDENSKRKIFRQVLGVRKKLRGD